jgi:glycosidase
MKKSVLLLAAVFVTVSSFSQLLTWSPQFPVDTSTITVTVDATKGNKALQGYTGAVFMHLGVITDKSTTNSDWKYVPTVWGTTTAPQATSLGSGSNKWSFTLTNPRKYFNATAGGVPAGETILKWALLFRDAAGNKVQKNTDGSDMYIPIYAKNGNYIQITLPSVQPTFNLSPEPITATAGQSLPITAVSSSNNGTLNLFYNNNLITGPVTGVNTIAGNALVGASGNQVIRAEFTVGGSTYKDSLSFYIAAPSVIKSLPANVKEGINYYGCTDSVTLVLFAPNKTNCMLIGDFPGSNWTQQSQYQMYKSTDGSYYWITVKGLVQSTEYAYQYLVDNSIYIADPHTEKILDPYNDKYITTTTYPDLKPYPNNPNVSAGKNGFISVLQICGTQYSWVNTSFVKPDKKNLLTYELLVRDFSKESNYQTIIDSIGYFRRLGINAIEFMPLQEFEGNNSWGYNPIFYYAPDKAYGTRNKLKELIDTLHNNGIAVILDVVYNHMVGGANPQGKLYWDATNNRPAANNPWFNTSAPHASLSFFEDLNHSTTATQYLVRSSLEHWIKEYRIDGFRFDFTKGFTQTASTSDNSAYDQSRIDNLNRYYDSIVLKYPGTYMILEHFCAAGEENVLINKGFMTWREMYAEYNQSVEGNGGNKNFSDIMWTYATNGRNAPSPALVGFMNSHDKERTVYNCIKSGASSGGYTIKDTATAVERMEAAASVLFTVPGPKLFYMFDEMGYDTPRAGNTDPKAPKWEYLNKSYRLSLYKAYSKIIQLRLANPSVFNNVPSLYNFNAVSGFVKIFQIGDQNINNMQVSVVANLGVINYTINLTFQKTGDWLNYISNNNTGTGSSTAGLNGATGSVFNFNNATQTINLAPGEYHIYVYTSPNTYTFTGTGSWSAASNWLYGRIPPSTLPAGSEIIINPYGARGECILNANQIVSSGAKITVAENKKLKIPLNLVIQ